MKLNKNKVELLAPAKNKETAFAAIDCGADAVYMGAPAFGARKNACNSFEDIEEVINYAHKFWVKVHITINTILTDTELDEAFELIKKLSDIGIDAVIIQDMGLLDKLIHSNIDIPIHMSTQCDNFLPQKVKFFKEIGVNRVILARELSLAQISDIHKENPELELECFVHGALCVSMSGQCYLSQYIGNRSANRGECAQPCRKQYDIIDSNGSVILKGSYPLCLKDFNGSEHFNELKNAGICSFKVEGRLKDIGYVKNITAYYRTLLGKGSSSGKSIYTFKPTPEKSFNRGFTDYFLKKRSECFSFESPKSKGEYLGKVIEINKDYFILDTDKKISPQDGLYFNNNGCLVNKVINKKIYPNKKLKLAIGDKIYRNLDVEFEKELLKPVKRQIETKINIVAGQQIQVTITDEDNISITKVLDCNEKANNPDKIKETFIKQLSKSGASDFYITSINIPSSIEIPFMQIKRINEFRRELFDMLSKKRLETYNKNKQHQNALKYSKYFIKEIDYRGNVHNHLAKEFYEKCGVKVKEPSFESKNPDRQVELMRCKHCIKYALNMCKSSKKLFLKDSHNKIYPLQFNCKDCIMTILSPN